GVKAWPLCSSPCVALCHPPSSPCCCQRKSHALASSAALLGEAWSICRALSKQKQHTAISHQTLAGGRSTGGPTLAILIPPPTSAPRCNEPPGASNWASG